MSPQTFCRQADFVPDTPFTHLEQYCSIVKRDHADLNAIWDSAIGWALLHMGRLDPRFNYPKDFFGVFGNAVGRKIIGKAPFRKALGLFTPELRQQEWDFPAWFGNRTIFLQAPTVLKFLQAPNLADFALKHRPDVPVFQIIRHPGGFLNSWANRYLVSQESDTVLLANRNRLKNIAVEEPAWGIRFGDPDALDVEEAELWYWCYANEVTFKLGNGRQNYRAIPYELLALNPLPIMQDLYEVVGLTWDQTIVDRILATSTLSASISAQWKNHLKPSQKELVERILDQSPLKNLWDFTKES
jgi:hypothetical protein